METFPTFNKHMAFNKAVGPQKNTKFMFSIAIDTKLVKFLTNLFLF